MASIVVFIISEIIARSLLREPFTNLVLNGTLSPSAGSALLLVASIGIALIIAVIFSSLWNRK